MESIKEPTTCHYVVTLATPALCAHDAFRHDEPTLAHIKCSPLAEPEHQAVDGKEDAGASVSSAVQRDEL